MTGSWKIPRTRVLVAIGYLAAAACQPPDSTAVEITASQAAGGPIHGYVATAGNDQRGAQINVPDIQVWAQNAITGAAGPRVRTNAAGYFHTAVLPAGQYNLCVGGAGYATRCETTVVTVAHSMVQLDHVLAIVPLSATVWGTVRLSDKTTPCFWFRPAFSTGAVIQAHVSLTDASGTLVAGPVNGNTLGEFVLPVAASPGVYTLTATCETASGSTSLTLGTGAQRADLMVGNAPPAVAALDLTQGGVGIRRADPASVVHATVNASDPDGDPLHYRWTDDSGRSLGLPDAPSVDWTLLPGVARNTLRVQVSDGRGGYAVSSRDLQGGPNALLFAGTVVDRTTGAVVVNAQINLNAVATATDARGQFQVTVPDAPRFVLNVRKPGYALASRIYYGRNTGLRIPLDPSVSQPLDAGKGGVLTFPCQRQAKGCETGMQLSFDPGVLVDAKGKPYTGAATIEAFQYDTSLTNPLPGDQGAIADGKTLRLSTFGAFFLQPRDSGGNPLQMAPGKLVPVSMPIESALQPTAPATIPFWRYDEDAGLWIPLGNLTRSGTRYQGQVNHFSAFNADTQFGGSACLKVILDPASFTLPVYLDAHYVDPSSGVFYHNNTQVTSNPVGIERMPPSTNFVLEVHDGVDNHLLKQVTLISGPQLDPALFPDGWVSDPNFDACNGPVTVYNDAVLPTGPTYLMPITGGSIVDNSAAYRHATDADVGGSRDTLDHWKMANDFPGTDASAIYFNNGDLKFGRDMHCHVTSHGTTACYVSNHGNVGTDDEVTALADARGGATPVATVTMEYDPAASGGLNVQFWAYASDGSYLAKAALDGQGAKPLPDICMACHYGYIDGITNKVADAQFLPFDLGSFHYDTAGDPHAGSPSAATVQEQFRQLNKLVLDTTATASTVQPGYQQLMNMWYPGTGGVATPGHLFSFTNGAAQLSGAPFTGHEPLYDAVVAPVCRTCHIAHGSFDNWTSFSQMSSGSISGLIQSYACGTGSAATQVTRTFSMPHAEVPFKRFWTDSLSSTLSSMLSLPAPGCPNH
ncbi:MAG TPA: hypothetical protein VHW23_13840 [Kofleriaceae bacterium]|jgi:hypothetical protein|nr:hypothetical protein [Kofleriaceae bacterium]